MKNIKEYFNYEIKESDLTPTEKPRLSENAMWLLEQRYFVNRYNPVVYHMDGSGYESKKESTFEELVQRVARVVASAETLYSGDLDWIKTLELNIRADMLNKRFCFNSPCLFNAGAGLTTDQIYGPIIYKSVDDMTLDDYKALYEHRKKNQQLFACFVIDVPDSIDGIFGALKDAAIISKYGGGVGANFGHIRERGASVHDGGNGGVASGPISFMRTFDTMANVVVQGGKRRAALMGMLPINHPDINDFIDCKTEDGKLPYFNVSVAVTDNFMRSLQINDSVWLTSPVTGFKPGGIKAAALFDKLCESAWKRGDPGVFFIDTANKDNLLKMLDKWKIESTNPCGEQPLPNYTSCNLGSINVAEFWSNVPQNTGNDVLWDEFGAQVMRSMYYLDLVIDASVYPLEKIEQRTKDIRPVGLGIMGLADLFIKEGVVYGSKNSSLDVEEIAQLLAAFSLMATVMIADVKGAFTESHLIADFFKEFIFTVNWFETITKKEYQKLVHDVLETPSIPISIKNAVENLTLFRDYGISDINIYEVFDRLTDGKLRNSRRLSIAPTGSISMIMDTSPGIEPNFNWHWTRRVARIDGEGFEEREYWHPLITDEMKIAGKPNDPVYVTAHDVTPDQHVEMVAAFAPYIDSGISKTVNLPESATVEDVKNVYLKAYKAGLKGITVYRDGSRTSQPIEAKTEEKPNKCDGCTTECLGEDCAYHETCSGCKLQTNVKTRPAPIIFGKTIKETTPWGSIYVTLNSDEREEPFEVFINVGKSGSELKAMTEALARVISIGLRSGCRLEDFIDTLKGLSGKEYWMLDSDDEHVVRSLPDAVASLLEKLTAKSEKHTDHDLPVAPVEKPKLTDFRGVLCPECGSPMELVSGCEYCFSCGYSPCK